MYLRVTNLVALFSAFTTSTAAFAQLANTDEPFPGQQWAVACKSLPVHSNASAFSSVVGKLDFGSVVIINELTKKYTLPDSQQQTSSGDATSEPTTKFAWAAIKAGGLSGFVPMSCLVNGNLAKGPYENPADLFKKPVSMAGVSDRGFSRKEKGDQVAMRGMSGASAVKECDEATISSRGFSRKEKGDQVAMRGMSKTAEVICVKEDFTSLSKAIDQLPYVENPHQDDLDFRRLGALGEFKK